VFVRVLPWPVFFPWPVFVRVRPCFSVARHVLRRPKDSPHGSKALAGNGARAKDNKTNGLSV
jgi:hypothetical protein